MENERRGCLFVFDNMLGSNKKIVGSIFFTVSRFKDEDVQYLAQSYFDLPKRTNWKNSNEKNLFPPKTIRY